MGEGVLLVRARAYTFLSSHALVSRTFANPVARARGGRLHWAGQSTDGRCAGSERVWRSLLAIQARVQSGVGDPLRRRFFPAG
jgi:hypothetical protein